MALTVETLGIMIQTQAGNTEAQLSAINKKLQAFGVTADQSSTQALRMGKSFNVSGLAIGAFLTATTAAITKFSIASTRMAMEAVESENLVATTFGGLTADVIGWSNKLQDSLGLNSFELRKNAALFFNISNSLGVTESNALTLSKGLSALAGDLASFYNISNDEAITKLRAGLVGETEPLKQIGVIVDENTTKQTAYRVGIAQTGQELDNNQKVLARYLTILQQTSTAQGDLARTINSPANQARLLQSNIRYLSTTFGSLFIPILNAVLPYLNAFVKLLTMAVKSIASVFGIAGVEMDASKVKTQENTDATLGYSNATNNAANSTKKLKKELLGLASFDEMNVLTDNKAGESGAGAGGAGSNFTLPEFPDFGKDIENRVNEIVDKAKRGWNEFFKPIGDAWDKWGKPAFDGLLAVIGEFTGAEVNLKSIGQFVGVVLVGFITAGIYVLTGLLKAWQMFFSILKFGFEGAKVFITGFSQLIQGNFKGAVATGLKYFMSLPQPIQNVILKISSFFANLATGITKTFSNITGTIGSFINNLVSGVSKKIGNLKLSFMSFGTGIVNVIKSSINNIIYKINSFLSPLQGVKIPIIAPKGLQLPSIPYLAQGGMVNSPTLAMMGEGGYSEAVLPLDRNTGWAEKVADLINNNMTGEPINLVVNIGGEKFYEKTIDYMKDKSLRTNINLMGL